MLVKFCVTTNRGLRFSVRMTSVVRTFLFLGETDMKKEEKEQNILWDIWDGKVNKEAAKSMLTELDQMLYDKVEECEKELRTLLSPEAENVFDKYLALRAGQDEIADKTSFEFGVMNGRKFALLFGNVE